MPPFYEEQLVRRAIAGDQHSKSSIASNRTQHKLQLQRLYSLTSDKNYLDHPKNMKRLTKELDRVNREYRCVKRFEDPITESFKRLNQKAQHAQPVLSSTALPNTTTKATAIRAKSNHSSSSSSSNSSSNSSSYSSSAEQNSFLGRWFGSDVTEPAAISQPHHSTNASMMDNSVINSFHPTIASNMKRRNKH